MNLAERQALIEEKIKTGGRRTTAQLLRDVLSVLNYVADDDPLIGGGGDYLPLDGSDPMEAALDMGGNGISNVTGLSADGVGGINLVGYSLNDDGGNQILLFGSQSAGLGIDTSGGGIARLKADNVVSDQDFYFPATGGEFLVDQGPSLNATYDNQVYLQGGAGGSFLQIEDVDAGRVSLSGYLNDGTLKGEFAIDNTGPYINSNGISGFKARLSTSLLTGDETFNLPGTSGTIALTSDIETHFRGKYISLAALELAVPTADDGDYAIVDSGSGSEAQQYIWDADEGWVLGSGSGGVTSIFGRNGVVTAQSGDYTTSLVTEGSNLYFTNARVDSRVQAYTGDVTLSGTAFTIANDVVNFAKMQNINTNRLLGRSTASSGDVEELSIGSALSLSGGTLNGVGYTLNAETAQFNPADATTYYAGVIVSSVSMTDGDVAMVVPYSGTVKRIDIVFTNQGTPKGSNETSSAWFRLTPTIGSATDTLISSSITTNATRSAFTNSGLSVSVTAGDVFEIKWTAPTYATNPTNVRYSVIIYIE